MSDRAKPRRAGPVGTDRPCPHQPPTIGAARGDRAAGGRRREQHGHCHSGGRGPAHRAALAGPLCHGAGGGGGVGAPPPPPPPPAATGPRSKRPSWSWPARPPPLWAGRGKRTGRSPIWPSTSTPTPTWAWARPARAPWGAFSRRTTCAWTAFDSWMDERDPDFVPKAVAVIEVELHPPTAGPLFCIDEKTGIGVRTRCAPSQAVAPGQPARREFEYVRHG